MRQRLHVHDDRYAWPYRREEVREILAKVKGAAAKLAIEEEVQDRAVALFTDVAARRFGRRIPHPVLAAALLYIASREKKRPFTLRDLAEASGSETREVGRCYVSLLEEMHLSRPALNGRSYVYHLALKRPISQDALRLAQEIIRTATAKGLGGRNPMTLAAAALYTACCSLGEKVTQAEVSQAAGVGEASVRECCAAVRLVSKPPAISYHRPSKPRQPMT